MHADNGTHARKKCQTYNIAITATVVRAVTRHLYKHMCDLFLVFI